MRYKTDMLRILKVLGEPLAFLDFRKNKDSVYTGPDPFGTMYKIGTDKPCVYTRPGGSSTDRICYLIPNGFTYEGGPMWNCTIPVQNQSCVNIVDPYQNGSDPKLICTYPIPCKCVLRFPQKVKTYTNHSNQDIFGGG